MAANVFETVNRIRKAKAILTLIPVGETALENIQIAANLEGWPQKDRDMLAQGVGWPTVSEATWVVVVELVRGRAGEVVKVKPYRIERRAGR